MLLTGDTHGGAKQQTTGIDSKQRLTQQSSIPATIPEEKENEAAAESNVAKQKDKSKGDKKKKNFDIASTKVFVLFAKASILNPLNTQHRYKSLLCRCISVTCLKTCERRTSWRLSDRFQNTTTSISLVGNL